MTRQGINILPLSVIQRKIRLGVILSAVINIFTMLDAAGRRHKKPHLNLHPPSSLII
jgi:hypothetical protein